MSKRNLIRIMASVLGLGARLLFAIPDRMLRLVFGSAPAPVEHLTADAWAAGRMADILDRGPMAEGIEKIRFETNLLSAAVAVPRPPGSEIRDIPLDPGGPGGPLRSRLYRSFKSPSTGPLLIFFHGGGWAAGSIESHDRACALLACNSGVKVLLVEYRLAPEDPFPAAADDALRAWKAVTAEPGRFGTEVGHIAVGGDSAGGNLSAVLCQDLRREGLDQPVVQVLIYPVTELGSTRASMQEFAEGYFLTSARMDEYSEFYVAPEGRRDVRVSPINEPDLSGLAPAWVMTALADPLRDEGEEYARRLAQAGVEVRSDRFPLIHGWFNMTRARSSREAHRVLAEGLTGYMADPAPVASSD